jgi:hypothetical protein
MTDLVTLVEPLKRELAVPGVFDDVFPDTTNTDLASSLADGFAQAQLDGFFPNMTISGVTPFATSADLSAAGGALVVLYAGMRIVRAQMRNLTLTSRYKAGSVETETGRSAMVLRDELTYMRTRLTELTTLARRSGRTTHVLDAYVGRNLANSALGGFYGYEYEYRA